MTEVLIPRYLRLLAWALAVYYVLSLSWTIGAGYVSAASGEVPFYTDYSASYAASLLLQSAAAEFLYVPDAMIWAGHEAAKAIYANLSIEQQAGFGFAPWLYPPTFILLTAPLALMPYWVSWFVWLGLTAIPFVAALRRILPAALAWPLAVAAPPVYFNVLYGQTGFLVGGLIGLGLALLHQRPWLAGVLIGLASVKPHFGVLIPLALAAGGHWRTFVSATLTVLGLVAVSVLAYGDEPWFAFIGTAFFNLEGFAVGKYNFIPMTSVLSMVGLAGQPLQTAWQVQYAFSAVMAILVAWVWWKGRNREETLGIRCAILCFATPLAVPMVYLYDLVLVVPAMAWLLADMLRHGTDRKGIAVLVMAALALLAVRPLAESFGIQIGVLLLLLLLAMGMKRFLAASRGDSING